MNRNRLKTILELLIVFILGLTPLLWFKSDEIILGHDAGLTLDPISHFFDRLFTWTDRFSFGLDQTFALPGFFIHGFEALVFYLTNSLQLQQKIVFIFWFTLPGISMYYLTTKLAKRYKLKHFVLPAVVFYMFNHFLLQGWFIAERTKFSLFAALPLILSFLFEWEARKKSTIETAILISITFFFLNGGGSLPLYGGILISILSFILFYLMPSFSRQKLFKLTKLIILTLLISGLLNAYWLFPFGYYVLNSYSAAVSQAGGLNGVLGWINYISHSSSFFNLFKLQGIPEWYQNSFHPYAKYFLNNPFLIVIASFVPILSFLPLYVFRKSNLEKKVLFFSFLALFSMIFIAGSHPPFGFLYTLLIKYIPGFIVFRTPFYKFASGLWFSYSILIALSIAFFVNKLCSKNKFLGNGLYIFFILGIILYSFPFLTGSFFNYIVGQRSMKVTVPKYVLDFGEWSQTPERINKRTLVLPRPSGNVDAYSWGYWSLSPLTSLLTSAPIINKSTFMPKQQRELVEILYRMMEEDQPGWINLSKFLGIESFLLRKDFAWNLEGSITDKPSVYLNSLKENKLELVKKFGEWEVYDIRNYDGKKTIETSASLAYLFGKNKDIGMFVRLPVFRPTDPIYVSNASEGIESNIIKLADKIYFRPECVRCNLKHSFINTIKYTPLLTRGSLLYPILDFKNKFEERKVSNKSNKKLEFQLYESLKGVLSIRKVIDEKKSVDIVFKTIKNYRNLLDKLNSAVDIYLDSASSIDNNLLIEALDIFRIEKTQIIGISHDLNKDKHIDLFYESYKFLEGIEKKVKDNAWYTTDEKHKRFLVKSPKTQKYNFLYKPNDPYLNLSEEIDISIDGKKQEIKRKNFVAGFYFLGKILLTKGKHKLEIKQSFKNLYKGPNILQVSFFDKGSCTFLNRITGKKEDVYRISFKHKRVRGGGNLITRIMPENKLKNPFSKGGDVLNSTYYWEKYLKDYTLSTDGESFYVGFCNYPSVKTEKVSNLIEIKDIVIRKIDVPDVLFYSDNLVKKPDVKLVYKKISQTNYNLNIKAKKGQKYIIVLNQSFSPGWEVKGVKKIIEKFIGNAYGNGWIVRGAGRNISIHYKPQQILIYGFAITFITIISIVFSSLILLLIFLIRKNKNNDVE